MTSDYWGGASWASSIPKEQRGFYIWSPIAGQGDYNPSTHFTATNCDNDGLGLNQALSDMAAKNVTELWLLPGTGTTNIVPSGSFLNENGETVAFQMQPGFPYNVQAWGGPNTPGATILQAGSRSTAQNLWGFVGGAQTSQTQKVSIGTRGQGFQLKSNGNTSLLHLLNLRNPGQYAHESNSSFYVGNMGLNGPDCTSDPLVMDFNENSPVEGVSITCPSGYSFSHYIGKGMSTYRDCFFGTGQGHVAALLLTFHHCGMPYGGLTVTDTSGSATIQIQQYGMYGCYLNQTTGGNWFKNTMGVANNWPKPAIVKADSCRFILDDGSTARTLIDTPTGGPVIFQANNCVFNSTTAGAHVGTAGTPVIDAGNNLYLSNVASPFADGLLPIQGPLLYQTPVDSVLSPSGTAQTTYHMMGLGSSLAFTPRITGRGFCILTGSAKNGTTGYGWNTILAYGTGAAPANAAAASGTTFGSAVSGTSSPGGTLTNFIAFGPFSGLTVGTAAWIDAQLKAVTGGTATITKVLAWIWEDLV